MGQAFYRFSRQTRNNFSREVRPSLGGQVPQAQGPPHVRTRRLFALEPLSPTPTLFFSAPDWRHPPVLQPPEAATALGNSGIRNGQLLTVNQPTSELVWLIKSYDETLLSDEQVVAGVCNLCLGLHRFAWADDHPEFSRRFSERR